MLVGVYKNSIFACALSALGVILCGSYSLGLYNRVVFGNFKVNCTLVFRDISEREFMVLLPIVVFIFIMGFYPSVFTAYFHFSCCALTFS